MTRTARYDAKTNTFRELPEMEEPQEPHLRDYAWSDQYHDACAAYSRDFAIYNDHLASLREIPGHESCRSVFKDQGVYEEGKDYEVKDYCPNPMPCFVQCKDCVLAYSITPATSEDEDKLWYEVKDHMFSAVDKNLSPEEWVGLMKGLYHITPR